MVNFRNVQDSYFSRTSGPESLANKQKVTSKETPQTGQIRSLVKQILQDVGKFFKQVNENSNCENHYVSMRHSLGKVRELAGPLFKKLAEGLKKGARALSENRVIRKMKDTLEFIKSCDLKFIRSSEDPFYKEQFTEDQKALLDLYREFEESQKEMSTDDRLSEAIALLEAIAGIEFEPNRYIYRNAMVAEVLTKHIVSQPLEKGMSFPIPCILDEKEAIVSEYKVDQQLFIGNTGIPVTIFVPTEHQEKLHPLLIFRGTKFSTSTNSDIRSIIENLNKAGPARGIYDQFKNNLRTFFKHWFKGEGTRPLFRIMGYSQGAVLGQRAIVDFYPYIAKGTLNASILFNSPGVEKDYIEGWLKIDEKVRPVVVNILITNDIISKRGTKFIGDVYEVEPPVKGNFLQSHLGAKLFIGEWQVYLIDNDKEGESATRRLVNEVMSSNAIEGLYALASHHLEAKASSKEHHKVATF